MKSERSRARSARRRRTPVRRLRRAEPLGLVAAALVRLGIATASPFVASVPDAANAHPSAIEQVERLDAAIRARPDDPEIHRLRGQVYSNDGHFAEALADFERAARLGDASQVAFDLGVLRYRMGELAEARRQLDLWLERHPGHPPALEYRARVLRDAGEPAAAVAAYRAYFAAHSRPNPGDYVAAARLLEGLEGEGVAGALALLDSGIERLGPIPQLQRPAIELERRRGRVSAAIQRLATLEPALGPSPDWKLDLAELLIARGDDPDREHARRLLEAAADQLDRSKTTAARQRLRIRLERLRVEAEYSR